jgi:hypothetical protein
MNDRRERNMKRKAIIAALALMMTSGAAYADGAADRDTTPVTQCEHLPPSVSIDVFSWTDTTDVCREMMRVLEGVRHKDITDFEKAAFVLHHKSWPPLPGITGGYGTDNMQVLKELIEIIRLRGLYDKPDRWHDTNDLSVKAWNAFNGAVGPGQIVAFLRGAGPDAAKALSDDGLITMIVFIKRQYQKGG